MSLTPAPHSCLFVSRPPHSPVPCLESLRSCQSPHPLSSVFCAGRDPRADSVSGQKALSLRIRALRASLSRITACEFCVRSIVCGDQCSSSDCPRDGGFVVVQWLGLHASAKGPGVIPAQGTKSPPREKKEMVKIYDPRGFQMPAYRLALSSCRRTAECWSFINA